MIIEIGKYIFIGVVIYLLITIIFFFIQERILFQSKMLPQEYEFNFDFEFEEVQLRPDDKTQLHGILLKAKDSKGVILYFHGNRGDLRKWGPIAHELVKFNYDVMVVDYRGYGKSTGERSEFNFHKDAEFWYDFLHARYRDNIVLYGRSLGTGIAVKLAASRSPKLLFLETPYYSILDLVNRYFVFLPMKWLTKYEFQSHLYMGQVECSVVVFHGTDDSIIPIESAIKLVDSSNKARVNFIKINDGKHNNLNTFDVYQSELERTFLELN